MDYDGYRALANSYSIISKELMKYVCSFCCCCACFTSFLLIIFGFASLEATEYGLNYSWISKNISPNITLVVKGPGLKMILCNMFDSNYYPNKAIINEIITLLLSNDQLILLWSF